MRTFLPCLALAFALVACSEETPPGVADGGSDAGADSGGQQVDTGAMDAGMDAGGPVDVLMVVDLGTDTGLAVDRVDAQVDAGGDAGRVTIDVEVDSGPRDAGPDEEGAADAGPDADEDAGAGDAGPDAHLACPGTLADCDRFAGNGCEIDLRTSVANCGACRTACPALPNAGATCAAGACGFACSIGYADCNRNPLDGCEVEVRGNNTNCGACGNTCPFGQSCVGMACACPTGQGFCTGVGCVSVQADPNNCGSCGRRCVAPASVCCSGVCRATCP